MTQSDLSVCIIGGGPAGCATALALQNKAKQLKLSLAITLCTAPVTSSPVIGETVPPVLSQYLRELGGESVLNQNETGENTHLICPGSISTWQDNTPGYNDFLFTPVGNGYHLNRAKFNAQLLSLCKQKQIKILEDTRLTLLNKKDSGFQLELQNNSKPISIFSDFVIDATGHNRSVVKKLEVAQNNFDQVVSLCAFYTLPDTEKKAANTIVSSDQHGWWYGTQLPNNKALISLCTDSQELKQLQLANPQTWYTLLTSTPWFYQQCCQQFGYELPFPDKIYLRVSPSDILSNVVGENWLAVGDAASSYDSISSAGITKSVIHGTKAGEAIATALFEGTHESLNNYQNQVFEDFNNYLQQHQMHYHSGGSKFGHSGFWGRRIAAA